MLMIQNYVQAQSLEEAWKLNQKKANRILGGMLWLRLGNKSIHTAIDLCRLGLDRIEETETEFSIGAMVSLRDLEQHEGLNQYTQGAVKQALKDIVGVQFRNMTTVGGSIWGRFGFSDVLTCLLSTDCYVELYKGGILPLEEFASRKPDRDLLVRILIKKTPGRFVYTSMRNQRTDFPVIACSVSCVNGEYRAALGARPARAILLRDEKGLLSNGINEESAKAFAAFAAEHTKTGSNVRGSAAYRTHLIQVLVERSFNEMGGNPNGN